MKARLALVMAVAGVAAAGGVLFFSSTLRGRSVDVTSRPEFAAALAQLAAVPACRVSYGEPRRGMNAEQYRFGRVWVRECGGEELAVGVPVTPREAPVSFVLERSTTSRPWALLVDPEVATATQVAQALTAFAPIVASQAGPLLEREREGLAKARREREDREHEAESRRRENAESFR